MGKFFLRAIVSVFFSVALQAEVLQMETRGVNGISDDRNGAVAFTGGVIVVAPGDERRDVALLIRDGVVQDVVAKVPAGYRLVDLKGGYVYPGFIDYYTSYGMPELKRGKRSRFSGPEILSPTGDLATNANDAIKSHVNASDLFTADKEDAKILRGQGFTTVASFNPDGLARGTALAVLTDGGLPNESILRGKIATHYSFDKGSSSQFVPVSRMGAVAVLRQTYLDADWYSKQNPKPFADISLAAWGSTKNLPKVMSAFDWKTVLLADKLGDEFDDQFVIRSGGDDYMRLDAIKDTKATLIVDVAFPKAPDMSDPFAAEHITLRQLKHWELAPYNLARLEAAGIPFLITAAESKDKFWPNLRQAVEVGLSRQAALAALTTEPAALLGEAERVGTLETGKLANMLIADGDLFESGTRLLETWVKGERFEVAKVVELNSGDYLLEFGDVSSKLEIDFKKDKYSVKLKPADDDKEKTSAKLELSIVDGYLTLRLIENNNATRLAGWQDGQVWVGQGTLPDGSATAFTLSRVSNTEVAPETDSEEDKHAAEQENTPGEVIYPFVAHGRTTAPVQAHILFKGATVWTNEADGVLENADVLVRNGKIQKVGQSINEGSATVVDATGMHISAGIIDEHSHIALDGINEFAVNSSMVRMADVVDPEDIGIYRNLAGGVTAAQLLHGSANPIGGQSALVKMRWGETPAGMLIEGADPFIKFALGENVKRSSNRQSIRFPQTRMGVEQLYVDAFTQARRYEQAWQSYNKLSRKSKKQAVPPRRDLVMETMLQIVNGERFVSSHSYVQSEINMLMHVAERFNFRINTFTHILEGYKLADKMAAHGAGGSTFSDWWGYKWEVRYAIPYNAALMHQAGVTVAINSDDPEMSRRLNQEAAKSVRYGEMSEEDALKMVTLNPAKLLHLDDRMGSIKAGKEADIVLWSDHPLSVYSKAMMTLVDGKVYFDRAEDLKLRDQIAAERNRLIQKALGKGDSANEKGAKPDPQKLEYHHEELHHIGKLLEKNHD
ncbi:MAG: imidazolonepropionase-like amidohydrolase [Candidatus Azotimanducaceae bacterium]|jgi:imidazolonepropionase-like amidohydrolase